jgi:hypothetical protein
MATPERYVIDTNVLVSFSCCSTDPCPVRPSPSWRTGVLLGPDSTLLGACADTGAPQVRSLPDLIRTRDFSSTIHPGHGACECTARDPGEPRRERPTSSWSLPWPPKPRASSRATPICLTYTHFAGSRSSYARKGRPQGCKSAASPEDVHCLRGPRSGMKVSGVDGDLSPGASPNT